LDVCCFLEIVQVTAKCEFSPFDGLHSVELDTRRRFCSRQLNVLLSSNAVLKGDISIIVVIMLFFFLLYIYLFLHIIMLG